MKKFLLFVILLFAILLPCSKKSDASVVDTMPHGVGINLLDPESITYDEASMTYQMNKYVQIDNHDYYHFYVEPGFYIDSDEDFVATVLISWDYQNPDTKQITWRKYNKLLMLEFVSENDDERTCDYLRISDFGFKAKKRDDFRSGLSIQCDESTDPYYTGYRIFYSMDQGYAYDTQSIVTFTDSKIDLDKLVKKVKAFDRLGNELEVTITSDNGYPSKYNIPGVYYIFFRAYSREDVFDGSTIRIVVYDRYKFTYTTDSDISNNTLTIDAYSLTDYTDEKLLSHFTGTYGSKTCTLKLRDDTFQMNKYKADEMTIYIDAYYDFDLVGTISLTVKIDHNETPEIFIPRFTLDNEKARRLSQKEVLAYIENYLKDLLVDATDVQILSNAYLNHESEVGSYEVLASYISNGEIHYINGIINVVSDELPDELPNVTTEEKKENHIIIYITAGILGVLILGVGLFFIIKKVHRKRS